MICTCSQSAPGFYTMGGCPVCHPWNWTVEHKINCVDYLLVGEGPYPAADEWLEEGA